MVRFKARLRFVVRDTPHPRSSQSEFAEAMIQAGAEVSQGTISNWINPKLKNAPTAYDLWVIHKIRTDIGVEWLLGLRPAATKAESYIEDEVDKELGVMK